MKLFQRMLEHARRFGAKVKKEVSQELRGAAPAPVVPPGRQLTFREYLDLNAARPHRGRIHYRHSLAQLATLARRHRRALKGKHELKDRMPHLAALARIKAMADSRACAVFRQAQSKKQQRQMGLRAAWE